MSNYTIELGKLIKMGYNIFDDSWSTFVPEHKPELCDKIIRHYYFYEIGQETPDRFKHYLNEQLALIMPYYNQLYESELVKLTPLYNTFLEEEGNTDRHTKNNLSKVNRIDSMSIRQMAQSLQKLYDDEVNGTRNRGDIYNSDWSEDKTGKENITENENRDTTLSIKQDTTDSKTVTDDKTVTENNTINEVMKDVQEGTKDTTANSNTTTSSTRRYSDTPQGEITASGGLSIDAQYLTNYTQDNGTQQVTSTGKETVNNTDDKTTDTTETKNQTTKDNEKTDATGDLNRTEKTDENIDKTKDRTYSEDTTGTKKDTTNEDETTKDTTSSTEKQFENGSTQDNGSSTSAGDENKVENEDIKHKVVKQGFTVSQSELLREWRKTFINIDEKIIRELGVNFMGVF